jgi:hypothetical protein
LGVTIGHGSGCKIDEKKYVKGGTRVD